jgi:hypothetical protein
MPDRLRIYVELTDLLPGYLTDLWRKRPHDSYARRGETVHTAELRSIYNHLTEPRYPILELERT